MLSIALSKVWEGVVVSILISSSGGGRLPATWVVRHSFSVISPATGTWVEWDRHPAGHLVQGRCCWDPQTGSWGPPCP